MAHHVFDTLARVAHDVVTLRHGKIDDGSMRFSRGSVFSSRAGTQPVGQYCDGYPAGGGPARSSTGLTPAVP